MEQVWGMSVYKFEMSMEGSIFVVFRVCDRCEYRKFFHEDLAAAESMS